MPPDNSERRLTTPPDNSERHLTSLPERLARAITLAGPMPVSQFMAAANAEYYGHRAAIGGDFVTAPEISQMFGELIGVALADAWVRAGRPHCHYVELGPGRGTLAVDALRAMGKAGLTPAVHFIETSGRLRAEQAQRLPMAVWHEDLSTLPDDAPLLIVANEFFDALPIEQLIQTGDGWRQRLVACQDTLFLPVVGKPVPDAIISEGLRDAPIGSVVETSPASVKVIYRLGDRLTKQGGAAVVIDYGYDGPALGETLQAVRRHAYANPFDAPGTVDLSAHVDFATLAAAAIQAGCVVHGPVSQRDFLGQLGIAQRAANLAKAASDEGDAITAAYQRLTDPAQMGTLFRVIGITGRDWPTLAGCA
jgi:NADH dehydrogenase [ubiquinone] 1 alpha subcomplex assembly factor 7